MMEIEVQTEDTEFSRVYPLTPPPMNTAPRISIQAKLEMREGKGVPYKGQRMCPLRFRGAGISTNRPKTNLPIQRRRKVHSQAPTTFANLPLHLLHTHDCLPTHRHNSMKLPLLERIPKRLVPLKKAIDFQCSAFEKYFR